MGIVLNQSFKNTLILILGFAIGALNTLYLYIHFLNNDAYYGLIIFLLSTAAILLPLTVFGMQHAVVKYFSSYKDKQQKDNLLSWSLILPMLIIIPLGLVSMYLYDFISDWISEENKLIKKYTYLIFLCAIFMGYFEVFYAWTKVQMNSVIGNFIREVFARVCASILLVAVFLNWISPEQFIYGIVIAYFLRMLIMMLYAFSLYLPEFTFQKPENFKEILNYSLYIILAGSAGALLLEIDKFMIPQMEQITEVAYYAVGIYIASVVAIPSRAMQQITHPITAEYLNTKNYKGVEELYKQSSINLLVIGGLLFLLINLNVIDMYEIINKPQYSVGVSIVFLISISELYKLILGINGAILTNSKYYRMFFYFSIGMAACVIFLNKVLINALGIDGAALATLITIFIFSTIKIWYINSKMDMHPFTPKTMQVIGLIAVLFFPFHFFDFTFHPIVNIILKSLMITGIYFALIVRLNISDDINGLVSKYFKK